MTESPVPGKFPHKRVKAYSRRHKALRIKQLLKDRKASEKAARQLDRSLGRQTSKVEAAFKGCGL